MKIIKSWIASDIILVLIYFGILCVLWNLNLDPALSGKWMMNLLLGVIAIGAVALFAGGVGGSVYYEYSYMPMSKFTINLYSNRLILVYGDHAWSFTDDMKQIAKLDEIKIMTYYNIKKKPTGWMPVPYRMENLEGKNNETK